jgi:hypothetical protein
MPKRTFSVQPKPSHPIVFYYQAKQVNNEGGIYG